MNTKTFAANIAREFGGLREQELNAKLKRLIIMNEFEAYTKLRKRLSERLRIKPVEIKQKVETMIDDVISIGINKIINSNKSDYVKMVDILEFVSKRKGYYRLSIFEEINCFAFFLDHADKYGIPYDEIYFYIK